MPPEKGGAKMATGHKNTHQCNFRPLRQSVADPGLGGGKGVFSYPDPHSQLWMDYITATREMGLVKKVVLGTFAPIVT